MRDFDSVPPASRGEIVSERDMYVQTAERLIRNGCSMGLFAQTIDPHLAATLIMGAISSTHIWVRPKGPQPLEQVARQIARQLAGGLLAAAH